MSIGVFGEMSTTKSAGKSSQTVNARSKLLRCCRTEASCGLVYRLEPESGAGGSVSPASQVWPRESATPMAIPVSRCYSTSRARNDVQHQRRTDG